MLHILHGANDLQREEALAEIVDGAGLMPDLRALNVDVLYAPVTATDLRQSCGAMPFLGDVRIVIARDVLDQANAQTSKEIAEYLPGLPETTTLIFSENKNIAAKHPVMAQAKKLRADVQSFAVPKAKDLPRWVFQRVQHHKGTIDGRAAALLAQNIGGNLRLLDQEIQKLLLYCGEGRAISTEDINVMVPYIQSADVIFDMVDAIGLRNASSAAIYLHRLLDVGEHPLGIFGMIVRQFRLLIQVRWLMDHRISEQETVTRLKLHPYVGQKIRAQAARFTFEQLRSAYQHLAETDLAIKTGLLENETALDLLIAQLTSL